MKQNALKTSYSNNIYPCDVNWLKTENFLFIIYIIHQSFCFNFFFQLKYLFEDNISVSRELLIYMLFFLITKKPSVINRYDYYIGKYYMRRSTCTLQL